MNVHETMFLNAIAAHSGVITHEKLNLIKPVQVNLDKLANKVIQHKICPHQFILYLEHDEDT